MPAAIRYNTSNPAIAQFNASNLADDTRRRAETAEFDKRYAADQSRAVDKAVREGVGAMYAGTPAATPSGAPVASPAPEPSQADVVATPLPDQPQPTVTAIPPQQMPSAAPPPLPAAVPNVQGPAIGSFTTASASPAAEPPLQTVASPTAPVAAPAVAAAPPTTTTAAVAPSASAAGTAGSRYQPLMESLARTPGAGSAMLSLNQQATADATRRQAAEIQMTKALLSGEPNIAEALANRYGLNIPPEVMRDRKFQAEMKNLGATIKGVGINDDGMAAQITRQYLDARKQGADPQSAWTGAFQGLSTSTKGPKMHYDSVRGTFAEEPSPAHPTGRAITPDGLPARPVGAGAAGSGSRQQQFAEWRIQTLTGAGVPPDQAARIVAGQDRQPTTKDVASLARQLLTTTDDTGARSYKNLAGAMDAARQALGVSAPVARPASPAPAAAVRPAAGTPPSVNAKGWRLMRDKHGAQAYVGPNNEIEDVR